MVEEILEALKNKELTLSCAESLTGGLFSSTICSVSGASKVFKGGVVTYWTEIKNQVINVPQEIIDEYGVVSNECASYMARGVKDLFKTDISISFTGNAGPSSLEGKPVGLVYIGICFNDITMSFEYNFEGNRNEIRKQCVEEGIKKIYEIL